MVEKFIAFVDANPKYTLASTAGQQLYAPRYRAEWLAKISEAGVRRRAELYYQQFDALAALRQGTRRELLAEARKHPAMRLLRQIPAIGPIRSALLIALIQTPNRFRTKRQLWAYSGLALRTYTSGEYRFVAGHQTLQESLGRPRAQHQPVSSCILIAYDELLSRRGSALDSALSFAKTPRRLSVSHVTCYTASLHVIHCKRALNFGEGQPEDLIRMWLGHASSSVTDLYAEGLRNDEQFRRQWCESVGVGFSLVGLRGYTNLVEIKVAKGA